MKFYLFVLASWVLTASAPGTRGYDPGDKVSDFSLRNFDGTTVSLFDYAGENGVIVIFDCNTCPYSKAYNERIIGLHRTFASQGFPVMTINPNHGAGDTFEDNVARATSKNYAFPYLYDESQQVAKTFGATNTPHVFVLQRKGNDFVVAYVGAIDNSSRDATRADRRYVEEAINALLEDKPVPVTKTRAIGCGIRWKDR